MNKWVIRSGMILCWLLLIIGFLYLPSLYQLLMTDRSLSIYCWADMIAPEALAAFEQQTGVKVYVSYYENNEELLTKLELNKGQSYDLVMPSDYVVRRFIAKGLLQPLDRQRLDCWHYIDKRLLGHWYDPANRYSIPYFWYLYGIGMQERYAAIAERTPSWSLLLEQQQLVGPIGLTDDPHEIVAIAAHYLFGAVKQLTQEQRAILLSLLRKLKPHVAVFSDVQSSLLLTSGVCTMMLTPSYVIGKAVKQGLPVRFLAPEDGTFMLIDNIVIPISCTKTELVYQFINFLYSYPVMALTVERQCYCAARSDLLQVQDLSFIGGYDRLMQLVQPQRLQFMQDVMTKQQLNAFWIALKTS
ncbi:spermidine/putrescine ABC transporter substrate-binding protein [Candidatus Dependentiae bacterium]|nr:spermidine/putrescine ABC transporter substrate-binding protein [Candidatus Dependentiae bacterium]